MCPAVLEDKTREYIDSLQGEAKDRDWTMQSGLYCSIWALSVDKHLQVSENLKHRCKQESHWCRGLASESFPEWFYIGQSGQVVQPH